MNRILVVEDDSAILMGIKFALTKEGFEVSTANTVKTATELFNNGNFNVILLDVMLPDGSGYDICRSIREKSDIPIIFLTACDEEVNVVLGLDIGGDDYITKPFRVKELISRIKVALRRTSVRGNQKGNIIRSGEITLYPFETKAQKSGEDIVLTPAEYKLLSTFIQNPGITLTREGILERLWDVDGLFVDDNTLSVYVRRLREKIEENPSKPNYILTVRGIGYKWAEASE